MVRRRVVRGGATRVKKLERFLLAKVPVWLVVVMLVTAAAGTVVFGALVRDATTRALEYHDTEHFLGRVALGIAEIPETLSRLLSGSHPAEAQEQRFDGRTGLDFADTAHASGGGGTCSFRDIFRSHTSRIQRGS